jgi:hypothetical protein
MASIIHRQLLAMHTAVANTQAQAAGFRSPASSGLNTNALAGGTRGKSGQAHGRMGHHLGAILSMPEQPIDPRRAHSQLPISLTYAQDKGATSRVKAISLQARLELVSMLRRTIQVS